MIKKTKIVLALLMNFPCEYLDKNDTAIYENTGARLNGYIILQETSGFKAILNPDL